MLSQLDTLIGFVVVMSIVSMLIMIATQTWSAFLGLRGSNLAASLEPLFHKIAPAVHKDGCLELIDQALTHPLISDTALSVRDDRSFLTHIPGIQWLRRRWMRATAVRADELADILRTFAQGPLAQLPGTLNQLRTLPVPAANPTLAHLVGRVDHAWNAVLGGKSAWKRWRLAKDLDNAIAAVSARLSHEGIDNEAWKGFVAAWSELQRRSARASAVLAAKAVQSVWEGLQADATIIAGQADHDITRFEKWFKSAQDRAEQWFAMHARATTVIFALIAAVALQLDTFEVFHTLSSNPDVRAKLVAQADSLGRQGAAVATAEVTTAEHANALAKVRTTDGAKVPANLPPALPVGLNIAGAENWLRQQLPANGDQDKIVYDYDQALRQEVVHQNTEAMASLLKDNNASTFQLLPNPYPDFRFKIADPKDPKKVISNWPGTHLAGILLSAALLGLGAPFWFNLLSQLSSLRPALADAVAKQSTQQKPPAAPQ